MAYRRITKEIKDIEKDPPFFGVTAGPIGDDIFHWKATIIGPDDTPYNAGFFELNIKIPRDYPYKRTIYIYFKLVIKYLFIL